MRRALERLGKDAAGRSQPDPDPPAAVRRQPPPSGQPRHRFVADGEVPVVRTHAGHEQPRGSVSHPTSSDPASSDRLQVTEAALRHERAARERAERSLQAAQAVIHDLQTKLGHAVLAHTEGAEALRAAEGRLKAAQDEPETSTQRADAREALPISGHGRRGRPARSASKAAVTAAVSSSRTPRKAKASPDKPVAHSNAPAQKPVQWWIKGWRNSPEQDLK